MGPLWPEDSSLLLKFPSGLLDFMIVDVGLVELGRVGVVVETVVDLVRVFSTLSL